MEKEFSITKIVLFILFLIALIFGGCWAVPQYNVYQQRMTGQAELQRAMQNRQIRVQEALAKEESARYEAQAEVIRARGVDSAIRIISGSLQSNSAYLQYLWINNMEKQDKTVVYIPSGSLGMPIPEAMRLNEH